MSKDATNGAPGLTTRSKKLLGAKGIATRSKDATTGRIWKLLGKRHLLPYGAPKTLRLQGSRGVLQFLLQEPA